MPNGKLDVFFAILAAEINNPDASVGAQCSMFRTVCSIRWLQSALIPFVTTQSVAEDGGYETLRTNKRVFEPHSAYLV